MGRQTWRNALRGRLPLGVGIPVILVALAGWLWLSRRPPPLQEERQALANQMGLQLDRLSFSQEMRWRLSTGRVWYYHPSDAWPGRIIMQVYTINGRLGTAACKECLPSLTGEDDWTSSVTLPGEPGIEIVEMQGRGSQPVLVTPEEEVQDLTVMALGAVLGVPVTDGDGRTRQPRLSWEGIPMVGPKHLQIVDVELRLRSRAKGIPRQVRIALIPETRQLCYVVVDRW